MLRKFLARLDFKQKVDFFNENMCFIKNCSRMNIECAKKNLAKIP